MGGIMHSIRYGVLGMVFIGGMGWYRLILPPWQQRLSTLTSTSRSSSCSGAGGETKVKTTSAWGPLISSTEVASAKLAGVMQWACKTILSAVLCLSTPIRARNRYSLW